MFTAKPGLFSADFDLADLRRALSSAAARSTVTSTVVLDLSLECIKPVSDLRQYIDAPVLQQQLQEVPAVFARTGEAPSPRPPSLQTDR